MHVWVMIVLPDMVVSVGWGGWATTARASTRCKSSLMGPHLSKFSITYRPLKPLVKGGNEGSRIGQREKF